ncbi:MAG: Mini-ribonuclease 3 [Heliobacteriaceae bacterium]|jgi:ribonuclease-3 family protein|nr:Mini-ribonuclease 3 [Heliobacteriaceae bacterium]
MDEMYFRNYAYLGDAVWELYIREKTIKLTGNAKELHKITTDRVKAEFQSKLLSLLETFLTEEEHELARRARNLPVPVGRRSIQSEYRYATAFETLIGWWYIHNNKRLEEMYILAEDFTKKIQQIQ